MMIYFCDRDLTILGNASTQLPDGFRITDDLTTEGIDTGVNTFSCVLPYMKNEQRTLEPMVAEGNYILKQSSPTDSYSLYDSVYQIIDVECDTESQEFSIYAEDAGLDLLNTLCGAVTLTGTIGQMMDYFLPSDWTVNLMEVPNTAKTNTWDGENTCTERLLSVANLWGCELYYSFVIEGLQIKKRVVNVTQKRGNQVAIPQLRLNYDLKSIHWKRSIANLVTALDVKGSTVDNTVVTLVGYNYSYTDPETGEVYKVDPTTGQMRNETAMAKWASAIDPDGLWVGSFQFDTTDQAVLAGQARASLQRQSKVEANYEVDFDKLPQGTRVGDRVNIIDDNGGLYLEARLLRIETCIADDTQTATIGEYLLRDSGISERVQQIATDVANARATDRVIQSQMQIITDTVDNMFTLEVDSEVILSQAYLTARLLNGNTDVKTNYDPNWFKWILRSENGERLLGRGYTYTANMDIIGYASTILCRFIRPQVYDLTDGNNEAITDANSDPIQVSFAGIYNQPVATRTLRKSKILRSTVEVGDPTLTREVNLYERDSIGTLPQHFWVDETGDTAGVHITEIPKAEFRADPERGGGNLLATSTGIKVRDGLTDLATFGAGGSIIGKEVDTHMRVTSRAMNLEDGNGVSYAFMGVSNDASGIANMNTVMGASTDTVIPTNYHIVSITEAVYSDGTSVDISASADGYSFIISNRKNLVFTVYFETDTPTPYYSFGKRRTSRYGFYSTVLGLNNMAGSQSSVCMGEDNTIYSNARASSILGGKDNTINSNAHRAVVLGGIENTANGSNSAVQGYGTVADGANQFVVGSFNEAQGTADRWLPSDNAFIVGNGTADDNRSNAMAVRWSGNVTIAGSLAQSSDKRLKGHISYLEEDADEFIRNLKPAFYTKDEQNHVGFYAQDVEEVDKWNCMTGEMNGFMTLGYTELIAPLVRYCQHLEERIAELEEKGKE